MQSIRLLLVDDEKAFLETIAKRLEKRKVIVHKACSGKDALAELEEKKNIDAVILDVKMPGMDGIETLNEIKRQYPLVEVIMLTGHATVETAIDGMKLGAFDYLLKPCDIDLLLGKANDAANKKRRHEEKIVEARMKEITGRMA
ncbi:response regulator [Desulfospira joergensenii]|uniref:response regulator n=1 Tax=Desulfospira joergensenii TaxID=53329 RepID=UPI0003B5F3FC|nr:response regulator [Desulfospira joergensenii]